MRDSLIAAMASGAEDPAGDFRAPADDRCSDILGLGIISIAVNPTEAPRVRSRLMPRRRSPSGSRPAPSFRSSAAKEDMRLGVSLQRGLAVAHHREPTIDLVGRAALLSPEGGAVEGAHRSRDANEEGQGDKNRRNDLHG